MIVNIAALLLSIFSVFIVKSSAELEQAIMKTDIERVVNLLSTTTLNSQTKTHLIGLAHDIIQKRLKMLETFSQNSHDLLDAIPENIEETLTQKTRDEIYLKKLSAIIWNLIHFGSSFAFVTALIDKPFKSSVVCFRGFLLMFTTIIYCFKKDSINEEISDILQQNYKNSILIKQIIMNSVCQTNLCK